MIGTIYGTDATMQATGTSHLFLISYHNHITLALYYYRDDKKGINIM